MLGAFLWSLANDDGWTGPDQAPDFISEVLESFRLRKLFLVSINKEARRADHWKYRVRVGP